LSCLPSPVCLVAHNGNAYDFPLLKAELEKLGTEINPGTLCADSLLGLRELLQKQGKTERRNPANVTYKDIFVVNSIRIGTSKCFRFITFILQKICIQSTFIKQTCSLDN
jgi:hypothetical protein